MSRHRTAYTDEDFYDYDDDYYDEEGYDDDSYYAGSGSGSGSQPTSTQAGVAFFDNVGADAAASSPLGSASDAMDVPTDTQNCAQRQQPRGETIAFILDMLGGDSIVTAARVGQMLDMFEGDSDKTVRHFVDKKAATPATTTPVAATSVSTIKPTAARSVGSKKSAEAKSSHTTTGMAQPSSSQAKSSAANVSGGSAKRTAGTDDYDGGDNALAYNPEKLAMRLQQQRREDMHIVQDLDALGFGSEAQGIESQSSVWTITEAEQLAAAAAEREREKRASHGQCPTF